MKPDHLLFLLAFLIAFLGCKEDRKFPEVKDLSTFKQTAFLPTLEHPIPNDKNAIYAASLPFAWDEIRKVISQPLEIEESFVDLTLLNNSKSYLKVLQSNEYVANGGVDGDSVWARAEFSKSLPFETKLTNFSNQLTFASKKVLAFGQKGHNANTDGIIKILYYKDDNNFIIKLSPKDKEHEIILCMSNKAPKRMSDILPMIAKQIQIGNKEKLSDKTSWRYYLTYDDEVIIPKFNFNIETNYSSLEGNKFKAGNQHYLIEKVYQRTAFMLDESGAEIESEAIIEAASAVEEEQIKPHPKKMRFDKPFFLILKRADSNNPYFGLWAKNTELMVTEK